MNEFSQYYNERLGRDFDENYLIRRDSEIKGLRKLSLLSGAAVLLYVGIQNGLAVILQLLGLWENYMNFAFFRSGVDIFMAFLGILLPFALLGKKMRSVSKVKEPVLLGRPKGIRLFLLAILACTGCIMLANIVSSYVVYFASLIGYELTAPDISMPDGVLGFLLSFFRVAVFTAVIEELSLRGIIMGNLKKYGEGFAIMMSAVVFSLMHGNLIQVPFALLAGMAMGYFTFKTGSIWTAIIAHTVNNGLSVILTYAQKVMSEELSGMLYMYAVYALIFIGMVAFFLFAMNTKGQTLKKGESILTTSEKVSNFLLTPTTIAAFMVMIYITAGTVSK